MYVCMHVSLSLSMYIYIYIEREPPAASSLGILKICQCIVRYVKVIQGIVTHISLRYFNIVISAASSDIIIR